MKRVAGFEFGPRRFERRPLPLIQLLRVLAALAVAMTHLGFELGRQFKWQIGAPSFSTGAGVDVFFVISGFIIVYVSEPLFGKSWAPGYFLARRLVRIAPLYWAATAIVLVDILLRYDSLAAANLSGQAVVASFYFFPYPRPSGQLSPIYSLGWTLNYEIFFYVVFSVAILAAQRVAVTVVAILFASLVVFGRLVPLPPTLAFWSNPIILEFVFGMLIAAAFRVGWRFPAWFSYGLVATGIAAYVLIVQVDANDLPRLVAWGLPAFCILAGLAFIKSPTSLRVSGVCCLLGNASYALYLVHPFVFVFPRRFFPEAATAVSSPVVYGVLLLGASVAAAIFIHLAIEKPITRMLRRGISRLLKSPQIRPLFQIRHLSHGSIVGHASSSAIATVSQPNPARPSDTAARASPRGAGRRADAA